MSRKLQFYLFIFSICIHLFFYVSAFGTHTLKPFFAPITVGQDFFQIPNAAYSFLHGGDLQGDLPHGITPYINCCGVNRNVYHPLFTLIAGVPLQFFAPWTAFSIWVGVHLLTTIMLIWIIWKNFSHHKYIFLALSLFLLNSNHYYEIWHAQFHFLFNFFTILFLIESLKKGDTQKAGIWLFLSLLVKPIGLLWILPLLLYKRYQTAGLGFGLYIVVTLLFSTLPYGNYYLHNFFYISQLTLSSHNIYSIIYLFPHFPLGLLRSLSILTAVGLIALQVKKKPALLTMVTLWVGFQLIFYPLVFHYQYTILAGLLCLSVLSNVTVKSKFIWLPILGLTLPGPAILYRLAGINQLSRVELSTLWLYSIFWLLCFLLVIVSQIIKKNKFYLS